MTTTGPIEPVGNAAALHMAARAERMALLLSHSIDPRGERFALVLETLLMEIEIAFVAGQRDELVRENGGLRAAAAKIDGLRALAKDELFFLGANLAAAGGLELAFRAGDCAGWDMAWHENEGGEQDSCVWHPGCGAAYSDGRKAPCTCSEDKAAR